MKAPGFCSIYICRVVPLFNFGVGEKLSGFTPVVVSVRTAQENSTVDLAWEKVVMHVSKRTITRNWKVNLEECIKIPVCGVPVMTHSRDP